MRAIITSLLRCPVTGSQLHLLVVKGALAHLPEGINLSAYSPLDLTQTVERSNLTAHLNLTNDHTLAEQLMSFEVIEGALYTTDSTHVYPIVGSIPRLLPPGLSQHPELVQHYYKVLQSTYSTSHTPHMSDTWQKLLRHNIESYTIQWDEFDYSDTTWGFTIEQRFQMILDELGITDQTTVRNKRHVDAACGNGTLALRTAEMDLEVFAFDQSFSIERAYAFSRSRELPKRGFVHFIQANLVSPPLQQGAFDMLYCGGAIHMTPDFRHTLDQLVGLIKQKDSRIYIWTGRRRRLVGFVYDAIRIFLKIFPIPIRRFVARISVVPYMMIQWILRQVYGETAFPKLRFNENLVRFLDATSHRFGQIPSAEEFELMFAGYDFDHQETKRPGHRGYGILAIRNPP